MSKPEPGRKGACLVGRMLEPKWNEKSPQGMEGRHKESEPDEEHTHIEL